MNVSQSSGLRYALVLCACAVTGAMSAQQQPRLVDRIVAVVGTEVILYSELAAQLEQLRQQGTEVTEATACRLLEDMLFEKLLLDQARIDSLVVDETRVDGELDRRIRYFVSQLGSEEKLEEFYGKTITEIKAQFREQVRDQMLTEMMQQQVVGEARVTPKDVQRFFDAIPPDSVPLINAQVEFAQIVRIPEPTEEEKRRVRRKIEELRTGLIDGSKDFSTQAILYSEDPGSAANGGELGLVPQGVMVPEFDAVALSLKEGAISQVFETQFGYHVMQMIERRGEQYNARHILLKPRIGADDLQQARLFLDSLATLVRSGALDFGKAASDHSHDDESKGNNGVVIEPDANSPRWAMGDLDQQDFFVIDRMKVGEVSEPVQLTLPDGSKAYRIVRLINRTEPHKANMKDDYQLLMQAVTGRVNQRVVDEWVREKITDTHVRVGEGYTTCPFQHAWVRTPVE